MISSDKFKIENSTSIIHTYEKVSNLTIHISHTENHVLLNNEDAFLEMHH